MPRIAKYFKTKLNLIVYYIHFVILGQISLERVIKFENQQKWYFYVSVSMKKKKKKKIWTSSKGRLLFFTLRYCLIKSVKTVFRKTSKPLLILFFWTLFPFFDSEFWKCSKWDFLYFFVVFRLDSRCTILLAAL